MNKKKQWMNDDNDDNVITKLNVEFDMTKSQTWKERKKNSFIQKIKV